MMVMYLLLKVEKCIVEFDQDQAILNNKDFQKAVEQYRLSEWILCWLLNILLIALAITGFGLDVLEYGAKYEYISVFKVTGYDFKGFLPSITFFYIFFFIFRLWLQKKINQGVVCLTWDTLFVGIGCFILELVLLSKMKMVFN